MENCIDCHFRSKLYFQPFIPRKILIFSRLNVVSSEFNGDFCLKSDSSIINYFWFSKKKIVLKPCHLSSHKLVSVV